MGDGWHAKLKINIVISFGMEKIGKGASSSAVRRVLASMSFGGSMAVAARALYSPVGRR